MDGFEIALPNNQNANPIASQTGEILLITNDIRGKLLFPKASVLLGCVSVIATAVPVPVTAIYEYCGIVFRQPEIWPARHAFLVQSKTKAASVQVATHDLLRLGVLPPDLAHYVAAFLFGKDVSHGI